MTSKKAKGQKMSLASFVGVSDDALPTSSSGLQYDEQRSRGDGRWDTQRADAEGRGGGRGGYGGDRSESGYGGGRRAFAGRSDEGRGSGGYGGGGGFEGDEEEGLGARADSQSRWRSSASAMTNNASQMRGDRHTLPLSRTNRDISSSNSTSRGDDVDKWRPSRVARTNVSAGHSSILHLSDPLDRAEKPADADADWRQHTMSSSSRGFDSDRSRPDISRDRFQSSYNGRDRERDILFSSSARFSRGSDLDSERSRNREPMGEHDSATDQRPAHLRFTRGPKPTTDSEHVSSNHPSVSNERIVDPSFPHLSSLPSADSPEHVSVPGTDKETGLSAPAFAVSKHEHVIEAADKPVHEGKENVRDRPDRENHLEGLGKTSSRMKDSTTASIDTVDSSLKPTELAPIKLASTRKTPQTSSHSASKPVLLASRFSSMSTPAVPVPVTPQLDINKPTAVIVMDESRYATGTLKPIAKCEDVNPLETALHDRDKILLDSDLEMSNLQSIDIPGRQTELSMLLARNILDNNLSLKTVTSKLNTDDGRQVLGFVLKELAARKGETEFIKFMSGSGSNVIGALVPSGERSHITQVLTQYSLPASLAPVPDLNAPVMTMLSSTKNPTEIVAAIDVEIGPETRASDLAKLVGEHVFGQIFTRSELDLDAVTHWSPLLQRVSLDEPSRVILIYTAQGAWCKAGSAKGHFKNVLVALFNLQVLALKDMQAWCNELRDKTTPGKLKAMFEVKPWIKEQEDKLSLKKQANATQTQKKNEDDGDNENDEDDNEDDDEDVEEHDDDEDDDEELAAYPSIRR